MLGIRYSKMPAKIGCRNETAEGMREAILKEVRLKYCKQKRGCKRYEESSIKRREFKIL